jgi:hypothetical protein
MDQQQKRETTFEELANELLLDLFEFLRSAHLLCAFYGLNYRFNKLISIYFRTHTLDFRCISKKTFDTVYQKHLFSIADQIISLHLSNGDETPNIVKYFLSQTLMFEQFHHLQSLSLYDINSLYILNQIIFQCRYLHHLTHLNMIQCHFKPEDSYDLCLINNIWSLPKLTHFKMKDVYQSASRFMAIKVISYTIMHLLIENLPSDLRTISHIIEYTPHLRYFSTMNVHDTDDLSLSTLKLPFYSKHTIETYLPTFSNLCSLTIKTTNCDLNGHDWENILIQYVPKIKHFQCFLRFCEIVFLPTDIDGKVNKLFDSFCTPFWIEKHQWYVRCDWYRNDTRYNIILYTLPYNFRDYAYYKQMNFRSSCPNDNEFWSYDCVAVLENDALETDCIIDFIAMPLKSPNIHHLKIPFPFNNNFLSIIPTLNHLTSLKIVDIRSEDSFYSQLQILLDRAPCLYTLIIYPRLLSSKSLLHQIISKSVLRLEFIPPYWLVEDFFNSTECSILAKSSLGQQCEILKIGVENRKDILRFVNTMPKLRLLAVSCTYNIEEHLRSKLAIGSDLIEWLRKRLPSTCSITQHKQNDMNNIELWIR